MRIRNKRGDYQSIDVTNTGRNDGSIMHKSQSAMGGRDIQKVENKLRMIEQISKYREDKIKKEFEKLDEDLRVEEEKKKRF